LRIGDLNPVKKTSDEGVSGIQMRLHNLGFNPGPIDGVMGPCTTAAIRAFQRKHPPLDVDGISGPETTERLLKEHGS
jgi:peptidoglycan hydrolase-like protein with peptidoglycan-binding domain